MLRIDGEDALGQDGDEGAGPLPRRRALGGLVLGLGSYAGLRLAAADPAATDAWYSQGVYPVIEGGLRRASSWAPFSIAEVLLLASIALVAFRAWRDGVRVLRGQRKLGRTLAGWGLSLIGWAGLTYGVFVAVWGLNHARQPYAVHSGLEPGMADVDEVVGFLTMLVLECNALASQVNREMLAVKPGDERIHAAYASLEERVPVLAGQRRDHLRRPWISPVLSALGISGIYSPFTAEAHLNGDMPVITQAFTACHEEAHARGFAREDEANFIAWQVCRASEEPELRYSGTYVAAVLTYRALERRDAHGAAIVWRMLSEEVLADLGRVREYWRKKRTRATDVAVRTNDLYLKSQGQAAGTESYGRMVDLLLAEWRGGS